MNEQQSGCKLTGYWGMTAEERASHDALLLNEERWKNLPVRERKSYLETLLLHTMIGYNITLSMLDDPHYEELRQQITSVLVSFSCRQEKLLRYIENITGITKSSYQLSDFPGEPIGGEATRITFRLLRRRFF